MAVIRLSEINAVGGEFFLRSLVGSVVTVTGMVILRGEWAEMMISNPSQITVDDASAAA